MRALVLLDVSQQQLQRLAGGHAVFKGILTKCVIQEMHKEVQQQQEDQQQQPQQAASAPDALRAAAAAAAAPVKMAAAFQAYWQTPLRQQQRQRIWRLGTVYGSRRKLQSGLKRC